MEKLLIQISHYWFSNIIPKFKKVLVLDMEEYIVDYNKGLNYVSLNNKFTQQQWF